MCSTRSINALGYQGLGEGISTRERLVEELDMRYNLVFTNEVLIMAREAPKTSSKTSSKTVYLFSRCSTVAQAERGDSLRRQADSTIAWIARDFPDWKISDKHFVLAGVSAFDGSSLGLGGFIEACKSGEIVAGESVLAIEAIDRLSRLEPDETRVLWRTLQKDYGIDIAVQKFGTVFRHDEALALGSDLLLTAAMHLARMESEQKSQRVRATHERRREESRQVGGKKRTSVAPGWLKLSEDRTKFLEIPERVKVLKRIYDLKLNHAKGPLAIASLLTTEGIPTFSGNDRWSHTIVRSYLTSKAAIGEFQPQTVSKVNGSKVYEDAGEAIKDYYPQVISESTFYATQKTFKTSTKGRKGSFRNLLQGMTMCHSCGGTMSIKLAKLKGTGGSGETKVWMRCSNATYRRGSCGESQIAYQPLEDTIVSVLTVLDYSRLGGGGQTKELEDKLDDLRLHRDATDERIASELDAASMASPGIRKRLMDRVNKLDTELAKINEEIVLVQSEVLSKGSTSSIQSAIPDLNLKTYEGRQAFNRFIKSYVQSIEPKKDRLRLTFRASPQEGAVIKYGDDPEQIVESLYKNPDPELGFDYGMIEFDEDSHGRGW